MNCQTVNQIYKWRKQLEEKQDDAFSGKRTAMDKDAKIQRLNKALAASQEENEFLKKRCEFKPSMQHYHSVYLLAFDNPKFYAAVD